MSSRLRRTGPEAPTLQELAWARQRYREIEPRDLFYRAATELVARAAAGRDTSLTLGEALAVLLFTWNRAYYQYHPANATHVAEIEALIDRHAGLLEELRPRSLASFAEADEPSVEALFVDFETLLGPVGAAKALHLLRSAFFPIWDRTIAAAYGCGLGNRGSNAARYVRFMAATGEQCRVIARLVGAPLDLVTAIDEWNYVRVTRGVRPEV